MIPGCNSDVAHGGIVFHVQTEDLGAKDPAILTLVYRGGAILLRVRTEYRATLGEDPHPSQVKTLMESQHRRILHRVTAGEIGEEHPLQDPLPTLTPPDPSPANASPRARSVDEMITAYLRSRKRAKTD